MELINFDDVPDGAVFTFLHVNQEPLFGDEGTYFECRCLWIKTGRTCVLLGDQCTWNSVLHIDDKRLHYQKVNVLVTMDPFHALLRGLDATNV